MYQKLLLIIMAIILKKMLCFFHILLLFKQNLESIQTTEGIPHRNEFLSGVYLEGSAQAKA